MVIFFRNIYSYNFTQYNIFLKYYFAIAQDSNHRLNFYNIKWLQLWDRLNLTYFRVFKFP